MQFTFGNIMPPKKQSKNYQSQLFKIELIDIVDPEHELVLLANKFNWLKIDEICSTYFCNTNGRIGHSSRLVIGLLLLKQLNNLSDLEVCQHFVQNPYYQYLCGFTHFEHKLKFNPSSLTKWRNRLGEEVFAKILSQTVEMGIEEAIISPKDCSEVVSDTTVQEKDITYPTDGKLLCKAIEHLVKIGIRCKAKFRQTYARTAIKLRNKAARLLHGRKPRQAAACLKQLRNRLGRIIREIERQEPQLAINDLEHRNLLRKLSICKRIYDQQRDTKNKVYSIHEPEVVCIAKGKVHRRYEFGCKVGIVTTLRNSFILAAKSFPGNPYDGHTLKPLIEIAEANSKVLSKTILLDDGYKGCKRQFPDKTVMLTRDRNLSKAMKSKLKKRSKIEPVIGLAKAKCGLARNKLKGIAGDAINALLSAIAYNLRIILRVIFYFIFMLIRININMKNHQEYKLTGGLL